jgi:hypothetical protein
MVGDSHQIHAPAFGGLIDELRFDIRLLRTKALEEPFRRMFRVLRVGM